VSERGQLSIPAVGVLLLLVLAGALLAYLTRVDEAGATAQRAADMAALAAAQLLADDPVVPAAALRAAADGPPRPTAAPSPASASCTGRGCRREWTWWPG
jgi:hypothetical protein